MRKHYFVLLVIAIMTFLNINTVIVLSTPSGPTSLSTFNTSRKASTATATKKAEAGNVTELVISGEAITQTWQGFVGNVSGSLTLDDFANNTLYNWSLSSPEGEVYATYLATANWTTGAVLCWNWSKTSPAAYLSLGELEGWASDTIPGTGVTNLSVATDDVDGVNETFTCPICNCTEDASEPNTELYNHSEFYVGGQRIYGVGNFSVNRTCPYVKLYNNTGNPYFEEVILYQDSAGTNNDGIIYTSILKDDQLGFNGKPWDFEMIVGEDGHNGNTATTTYYFYIELE